MQTKRGKKNIDFIAKEEVSGNWMEKIEIIFWPSKGTSSDFQE